MADSRTFDLHPQLAAWIDREATRIAGFVQDVSDKIDELFVEGEFPFGTALLAPLSRSELDAALDIATSRAPAGAGALDRERHYTKWLGKAVMRFELEAEPKRAQELAAERAADYMSLLQFYAAPAMVLPLASHVAPSGVRSYRTERCIAYARDIFVHSEKVAEPSYQLQITSTMHVDSNSNAVQRCSFARSGGLAQGCFRMVEARPKSPHQRCDGSPHANPLG
jgi:hypothetical protein